ncbi:MAG: hypothetical protein M3O36_16320 [Myxococcota bacterium]|nr:hypothetical protein [Myxococcota bacterium]
MLRMRLDDQSGNADEALARTRMVGLASRFPGALREIDDLTLAEIRRRIAAIDAVLVERVGPDSWMVAMVLFHSSARGVLCAKRWLAGRKHVDSLLAVRYARAVPSLRFPDDAVQWIDDLPVVAQPPRGRLLDVVYARIAGRLRTSEDETRRLVFGLGRAARMAPRA